MGYYQTIRTVRMREKIIGKRNLLKMTQEEVAEQMYTTRSNYQYLETKGEFSFDDLANLFHILKFTEEEILEAFK